MEKYERKNRIKEALELQGLKQVDLCNRTGLNKSAVANWIKQRWQPKQTALHIMAKTLNVSEMWLAGYDTAMERPTSQRQSDAISDIAQILKDSERHFNLINDILKLDDDQLALIEGIISQFKEG